MKPQLKKVEKPKIGGGIVKKTEKVKATKKLAAAVSSDDKPVLKGILKKNTPTTNPKLGSSEFPKNKKKHTQKKPKSENAFTKVDDTDVPADQQGKPFKQKFPKKDGKIKNDKTKRVFTKKERRQARLNSKKHSDVVPSLLADWEILRRDDTEKEKKHELIETMLGKTKNKLMDLCRARDTSRIVESIIQFGTEAQRWILFAELKDRLRLLAMSQYAKHVVLKLITYGAKEHRVEFFKMFRGHIAKMLRHKHAAEVIELLYNDYATAAQRALILQEAYGHQFALQLTSNNVQKLEEAIALNPEKRQVILGNLNDLLVTMVSKGLMRLSIVQHLLLEYLTVMLHTPEALQLQTATVSGDKKKAPAPTQLVRDDDDEGDDDAMEDEPPKEGETGARREDRLEVLIETILEAGVVSMLHTREGVKASLAVLWICPPKDRKSLIKSMKTCVTTTAENEHGHIFLMGLLDAVDDTKLLAKTIIKELLDDLEDVIAHPHARKVLLYALAPREPKHFAPALVNACLVPGDSSPFTKKPLAVRALELRAPLVGLLPALLHQVAGNGLIPLFLGSTDYPSPLDDRSRIVLLAEILIRSSAHELQFSTAASTFKRTGPKEEERVAIASKTSIASSLLTDADLEELGELRGAALRSFVAIALATSTFKPTGLKTTDIKPGTCVEARRTIQTARRKRALAIAQSEAVSKRKVSVKAFTNTDNDDEEEPMETNEQEEEANSEARTSIVANTPFLERPEGQLLVSRILQAEKKSGSHELGSLIVEMVPTSTLIAWLSCNRSCFTLVHVYELGDAKICKKLETIFAPSKEVIMSSPLPGANILAKHLFKKQ